MTYLRCKNRRRAVCPSCSHQYQGDVFHVIMAGAAGGMKDVPADVVTHPLMFATLTAPSFGPVHAAKKPGRGGSRRCRPRSGEAGSCARTAGRGGAWPSTTIPIPRSVSRYVRTATTMPVMWCGSGTRRSCGDGSPSSCGVAVAHHLGMSETACKALVRVQFAKVVEFQRRGIVHYHALIRLDGAPTADRPFPPPAVELGADLLADLAVRAARQVEYDAPPVDGTDTVAGSGSAGRSTPGQSTTRPTGRTPAGAAAAPGNGRGVCGEVRHQSGRRYQPGRRRPNPHLRRLKTVVECWRCGPTWPGRPDRTARTRVGAVGSTCSATAAISPRSRAATPPPWAGSARPVATTPAANTSSNARPRPRMGRSGPGGRRARHHAGGRVVAVRRHRLAHHR